MNNRLKKLIAMLLTVAMMISMLPATVIAEELAIATPAEPVIDATEEPVIATPAEPVVDSTEEPVIAMSAEPVIDATEEPVITTPAEPVVDTTEEVTIATSVEPVVDTTEEPVIATPAEPIVDTTEAPVIATSAEPVVDSIEEPVIATPAEPVVDTAEASVIATSAEPVVDSIDELVIATSAEPVVDFKDVLSTASPGEPAVLMLASTVCDHLNVNRTILSQERNRIPTNSSEHLVVTTYQINCSDCDTTNISTVTEEQNEAHSFDQAGSCIWCFYLKSDDCQHNNLSKIILQRFYYTHGDYTHIRETVYSLCCDDCGAINLSSETEVINEVHSIDKDGFCSLCSAQLNINESCAHENYIYLKPELTNMGSWANSNVHSYLMGYNVQCEDCFEIFYIYDESATKIEEHKVDSENICIICGYDTTPPLQDSWDTVECNHENVNSVDYNIPYFAVIDGNEKQHKRIIVRGETCNECGLEREYEVSTIEEHSFDGNNRCTVCYYERNATCNHVNQHKEQSNIATFSDEDGHEIWSYTRHICDACEEILNFFQHVTIGCHSYSEYGFCSQCGYEYKEGCVHKETTLIDASHLGYKEPDDVYVFSPSTHHMFLLRITYLCNCCNETLVYDEYGITTHHFSEGVCDCGYREKTCDHAGMNYEYVLNKSIPTQYVDTGDGLNHYIINSYSCICKDCGSFVGTVMDEYTNGKTEAHTYNENGACVCGATTVIICPHVNVKDYYDNGALKPIFSNITETHHDVQNGYMRYCEDCKKYTGETGYFDAVPEAHDFTNGDVCVCGYDRTCCAHTNKTAYYDSSIQPIFENITETQHDVRNGYQMICDSCNEPTGETGYFDAVPEEHDFTNGDVCVCGYDRTNCVHSAVEGSAVYVKTYFEAENSSTHKAVADDFEYTCSKCHNTFVETKQRSEDTVEKGILHAWGSDGVCLSDGCGYACAHPDITKAWVDGKSKTIKLTDNKDGATHTHTYSALATCNTCQSVLGMMEEIIPNEPHRVKNGRTYYNQVEGGHQKVTPRVCSCGYSEKPVVSAVNAHAANSTAVKVDYDDGGNIHYVNEVTYNVCVCGIEMDIVYIVNVDISAHVDKNKDGNCDLCDGEYVETTVYSDYNHISQLKGTETYREYLELELKAQGGKGDYFVSSAVEEAIYGIFGDELGEYIIEVLENADSKGRDMYLEALPKAVEVLISRSEGGSYYNGNLAGLNSLVYYLSTDEPVERTKNTLMHEVGHLIDDLGTPIDSVTRFFADEEGNTIYDIARSEFVTHLRDICEEIYSECTEKEIDKIVSFYMENEPIGTYESKNVNEQKTALVYDEFYINIDRQSKYIYNPMVAEIYGRFTGKSIGVHAHPEDYFEGVAGLVRTLESELWAEYYAARMTNDTRSLEHFEKLFPETKGILDDLYDKMWEGMFK